MQVENTRTPPIQLKHHFFSIINVVARQDIQSENQSIETGDAFRFDVGVGEIPQHEEDPTYQVSLRIRSQENSEQPLPYEIDLETIGFVTVSQDCPQEKAFGYVQVLGPTLLFGGCQRISCTHLRCVVPGLQYISRQFHFFLKSQRMVAPL